MEKNCHESYKVKFIQAIAFKTTLISNGSKWMLSLATVTNSQGIKNQANLNLVQNHEEFQYH